ncbi:MAG: DNA starvation/stationary phase protection protein [Gammaproteobacteria bacterium]
MKVVAHKNEHASAEKVCKELKKLLADTFTLYVKALNYHWNVKGPMFLTLHEFFESQYTALNSAIDGIAERIRQLDSYTPASLADFKSTTSVEETTAQLKSNQMIESMIQSHEALTETCHKALKAASQDEVTADLVVERLAFHEKSIWMLKSLAEK